MTEEGPNAFSSTRFKNRRRMAWWAIGTLIVFTLGMLFRLTVAGDDPAAWSGIGSILLGSLASIVLAYTGAAAYEHTRSGHDQPRR